MKTVLSIAGSDSSGGVGIQADLKTMIMNGVYAMSAVTALTAQNTVGVRAVLEVSADFLKKQLDAVFEDIFPDAVKIGMLPSAALMETAAERLRFYGARQVVVDPVMVSTSGSALMRKEAVETLKRALFPLARVVTPNIPEGEVLSGLKIGSRADMERAAAQIGGTCGCAVLLKGGHGGGADDLLYENGRFLWFAGRRLANFNTHGTGCTLSSAIAANLAKEFSLEEAVGRAKEYVSGAIRAGLDLGRGSGPLDHGFPLSGEFADRGEEYLRGAEDYERIHDTDGCRKAGNHYPGDAGGCKEGVPDGRGNPGARGEGAGGDLCQPAAQMHRPQRGWLHAEDQGQCEPGGLQRLQGL